MEHPKCPSTDEWIKEIRFSIYEKGMAIHSRILAWRIPWTEKPELAWACPVVLVVKNPPDNAEDIRDMGSITEWSRAWQPTPVLLPGENPVDRGGWSIELQRVRHNWSNLACMNSIQTWKRRQFGLEKKAILPFATTWMNLVDSIC